ncbi:putative bifunctional diguanylate cyclase/phosphodiesterase [Pseudocolwellia sp. HL-MZ19]|uniref:putative bifunctional diguanylate cyclase/phosphodiesterase n=1 Tax=unclassified Pseudocolwellia TaxID=2848178 RepID=UPI003CF19FD6
MNVLIVDDDLVDRELIKRTLKRSNITCNITEVESIDDALIQLNNATFDTILLDYNLPQRNGIELLLELKDAPKRHSVAVIMMSTSKEDELALSCINAGAQDFLVKNEINVFRLQRAIINAQARSDLEKELYQSYQYTKKLSEHDSLTGLSNRYFFDEALIRDIKSHQRDNTILALLLIDLDHFKFVNDNFGHDVGDQLLIEVVKRISNCLRGNEVFARLGGDEFAITLKHLSSINGASIVAQRIINSLNEPIIIDNHSIRSGASIGIAICPWDSTDTKELFKFADIAMYKAKNKGRSQFSFFEEEMQKEFLAHFTIEDQLKTAINNNDFYLHYQPVIDSKTEEVTGVEALIRWQLEGEMIGPDTFIPIAEKSRLIIEIGKWVLQEAIKQLSYWNKNRPVPITMAINLSSRQLTDEYLLDFMSSCLNRYGVPAHLIEVELTETALIVEPEKTAKVIQGISDLGCIISLDDFGTGFSSLSHLHSFPIDIVKIDKSLMPNASSKEKLKQLLTGLVVMIQSLELEIVAEGVETESDLALCKKLNVDKMQGYYFDKALTAEAFKDKYL